MAISWRTESEPLTVQNRGLQKPYRLVQTIDKVLLWSHSIHPKTVGKWVLVSQCGLNKAWIDPGCSLVPRSLIFKYFLTKFESKNGIIWLSLRLELRPKDMFHIPPAGGGVIKLWRWAAVNLQRGSRGPEVPLWMKQTNITCAFEVPSQRFWSGQSVWTRSKHL